MHDLIAKAEYEREQLNRQLEQAQEEQNETFTTPMIGNIETVKLQMKRRRKCNVDDRIYALSWSRNSSLIASVARNNGLTYWRAKENKVVGKQVIGDTYPMCCALSPSDRLIAYGGIRNIVSVKIVGESISKPIYEYSRVQEWRELCGHDLYVSCCEFVNENQLLSGSGDASCILWDVEIGRALMYFKFHISDCMSISINPIDRNLFATGSCDMKTCLWDLRMKKSVKTFEGHTHDINSVTFLSNGLNLATGSEDASCKIFDLRSGKLSLMTFSNDRFDEGVAGVCCSKSGRILFSANGPSVVAWDTLTGNVICEVEKLKDKCSCLSVSPDGSALAVGSWDNFLKIFA